MARFARVDARASQVDACVAAIEHTILSGEIPPGDHLPSERDLAVRLGVARLTLRAALQRLAASGLIASRHGSGTVVLDLSRSATPGLMSALARAAVARGELPELADELLSVRRALASAILERLATREVGADAMAELSTAIDIFHDRAQGSGQTSADFAECDHRVVAALVVASDMAVAGLFLNPVFTALRELPALRDAIYANPADNVERWRMMMRWLRTKDRRAGPLVDNLAEHDRGTIARLRKPARKPAPKPRRPR